MLTVLSWCLRIAATLRAPWSLPTVVISLCPVREKFSIDTDTVSSSVLQHLGTLEVKIQNLLLLLTSFPAETHPAYQQGVRANLFIFYHL